MPVILHFHCDLDLERPINYASTNVSEIETCSTSSCFFALRSQLPLPQLLSLTQQTPQGVAMVHAIRFKKNLCF
jgi:hypothetical protein